MARKKSSCCIAAMAADGAVHLSVPGKAHVVAVIVADARTLLGSGQEYTFGPPMRRSLGRDGWILLRQAVKTNGWILWKRGAGRDAQYFIREKQKAPRRRARQSKWATNALAWQSVRKG